MGIPLYLNQELNYRNSLSDSRRGIPFILDLRKERRLSKWIHEGRFLASFAKNCLPGSHGKSVDSLNLRPLPS